MILIIYIHSVYSQFVDFVVTVAPGIVLPVPSGDTIDNKIVNITTWRYFYEYIICYAASYLQYPPISSRNHGSTLLLIRNCNGNLVLNSHAYNISGMKTSVRIQWRIKILISEIYQFN